ncbi:S-methyl-5'-thioadenosine phosphorylase [Dehalobacterium formicoaceticum]|uniref:Probable 6-oxopurine nucleoside phosphorylase n=1 Tax=Dehalobacterium formicoaceticum TaxID=51515 RepID=A0ABT1Y0V5_9FIRM|nr:S-methyl-5'-thioadenosine phosphorylase [Dehalobacterium formicoaceticum]MCR6544208.1 S-methyl-5'-thioadenosine phosphorylase [Dehalobacterium formicoaceticum]
MAPKIAIIGGTGVYNPDILSDVQEMIVENVYGKAKMAKGTYQGKEIIFLARHGATHSLPPHLINYRANIRALKEMGVERVLATAAVGSLNETMAPGSFVLVDQFLDFTKNRISTFFDGGEQGVTHTDMTNPYCPQLIKVLAQEGQNLPITVHQGGTYVTAEGPRFETPAEIRMFKMLGGDVVGMTSVPEVVLAREAGLCYATIGMVTNFAAGISPTELSHQEVLDVMSENSANLSKLLMKTVENMPEERTCKCGIAS